MAKEIGLRTAICAVALATGLLAASSSAAQARASAAAVDRARLDALVAEAEAADSSADPAGFHARWAAALEEARRIYPERHPQVAASRAQVATGLAALGRLDEAAALLATALPQLEAAPAGYEKRLAEAFSLSGYIGHLKGDHAAAIAAFERAMPLFRQAAGGQPSKDEAINLSNLAGVLWEAGQAERALDLNAQALAIGAGLAQPPHETALWYANRMAYLQVLGRSADAIAAGRAGLALAERILPPGHPMAANLHANMGALLMRQGRPRAAAPLIRRAFETMEAINGRPDQNSATMRAMFASALIEAGDQEGGAAFIEQALPIIESELGPESNRALGTREVLARVQLRQGRLDDALANQQAVLAIRDRRQSPGHRERMSGRANLARILLAKGDHAAADRVMAEGLALRAAAVPADHPELLAETALALLVRSRGGLAPDAVLLDAARGAFAALVANAHADPAEPLQSSVRSAFAWLAEVFQRAGDVEGAFAAQQWSARTTVDDAEVAAAALRLAAEHPDSAALLARRRELAARRAGQLRAIDAQLAAPSAGFDLAAAIVAADETRRALAAVDADLAAAGASLPRFAAVPLETVQAGLADGDMFVQASQLADAYIVTVVTARRHWQYLTGPSAAQIAAQVGAVRASLDPLADRPFDRAAAAALHDALFSADVRPELRRSRHLLASANGALDALPLAVLAPQAGGDDYLIDRLAISRLPGALRRLHGDAVARKGPRRLFAMGDVRPASGVGAGDPASRRGAEGLDALPPLPAAAAELADIARVVGDPAPLILTGAQATEAALRAARIESGSVLAFATHGLVSGEIEGLREPALLLSADGEDDGLLTASEIARLSLPARWVVLSACNTAAGSDADAPGLSGLAQAFITAGADKILATHWQVRDDAARAVSSGALRHAGNGLGAAEALRRSIRDIRAGDLPGARHPAIWAAFELVE